MNKPFSIYLDLVRITAAMMVFLTHAGHTNSGGLALAGLNHFGHDAVVIFFVLSGLVIAYTADTRERDMRTYMISRFARLWSVVVPALALTIVADWIGMRIAPDHYFHDTLGTDVAAVLTSLFFVNQLWTIDFSPMSNSPFWSLGFEFWYYVVFALAVFLPGWKKHVAVLLACAIMGPKILVMLPIWLLGVGVYRYRAPDRPIVGVALIVGSVIAYAAYRVSNVSQYMNADDPTGFVTRNLGMANYFLSDYLVAVILAAHFIGFRMAEPRIARFIMPFERPIRLAAGCTFSVYLFHRPLLFLLGTVIPDGNYVIIPIALTLIAALASVTEQRKNVVRRWLGSAFAAARPAVV